MEKQEVEKLIARTRYYFFGDRTTVCVATLNSGWEITGSSSTVNSKIFDENMGRQYAYDDVLTKLEPLEAYFKHEYKYRAERGVLGTAEK